MGVVPQREDENADRALDIVLPLISAFPFCKTTPGRLRDRVKSSQDFTFAVAPFAKGEFIHNFKRSAARRSDLVEVAA